VSSFYTAETSKRKKGGKKKRLRKRKKKGSEFRVQGLGFRV